MESFNYNHLFYFWTVARNGSVSRASAELRVSQPTVSEQIGKLEETLGVDLFEREGRGIRLSSSGQVLFGYAEQIFRLGEQLRGAVENSAASSARLAIGVVQSVPNLVVLKLLKRIVRDHNVQLSCCNDRAETLIGKLALRQLDFVISDSPLSSSANVRVFSHKLASSAMSFMASPKLRLRGKFPQVLQDTPFLMPEANSSMRESLQGWLKKIGVRPKIVGEFSDPDLMKLIAGDGMGVFAVPSIIERELKSQYKFNIVGTTNSVRQEFYAFTADRRPTSAATQAILKATIDRGR
jgi:LysR family transcriptional activator of nhaA